MALIDSAHHSIDYNKFARLSRQLRPGMVWVSSGATEIGRLDYMQRNGAELNGDADEVKMDYAAQGQAILMQTYRNFIDARYSVRQVLVEHGHFNDPAKRENIRQMLLRAPAQNAVPIVNYNDAVSCEENRKMEIRQLQRERGAAVELVDNDETAAQIACLVRAKTLLIFSTLSGIYSDVHNPATLIREISAPTVA
ncbi:MAG: uridylate kinase, partial [Clostridiales bacterium]|nr:uridylate kinase [Clostridiales bacterium]